MKRSLLLLNHSITGYRLFAFFRQFWVKSLRVNVVVYFSTWILYLKPIEILGVLHGAYMTRCLDKNWQCILQ